MKGQGPRWPVAAAIIVAWACSGAGFPAGAAAQGFSGQLSYTGSLGPVSNRRPLCVCVYGNAQLTDGRGCLISSRNGGRYEINTRDPANYFVIGFLDIHANERLDPDEPFEIFFDKGAAPADAVVGNSGRSDVDLVFGDENLPGAPTRTPTVTATPTETPVPPLPGDCDGNGIVSVDELIRAVAITLDTLDLSACPAADSDGNGSVSVDDLVRAVQAALHAPPSSA